MNAVPFSVHHHPRNVRMCVCLDWFSVIFLQSCSDQKQNLTVLPGIHMKHSASSEEV